MRRFVSADRVTALVSSAAAKARCASPIRLRATEGGLGCWLALEAPSRVGGEGWLDLEGIAAEAPPPLPPYQLEMVFLPFHAHPRHALRREEFECPGLAVTMYQKWPA